MTGGVRSRTGERVYWRNVRNHTEPFSTDPPVVRIVAGERPSVKLIIVEDGARTALDFDKPVVSLGRAIDNDIRLAGAHASRHHCKIEQGPENHVSRHAGMHIEKKYQEVSRGRAPKRRNREI